MALNLDEAQLAQLEERFIGKLVTHEKYGIAPVILVDHLGYLTLAATNKDFGGTMGARVFFEEVNLLN